MTRTIRRFVRDNTGVTIIEYGLIAALIAVGLVTILGTIGDDLNDVFTSVSSAI